MNKLYGIIENNYVRSILVSSTDQDYPWVELPNDILSSQPSPIHKYNIEKSIWEAPQFDLITPQWSIIKEERNKLLQQSDWSQLSDIPIQTKEIWAIYRQQLRDITNQSDPFNIVWPQPPE